MSHHNDDCPPQASADETGTKRGRGQAKNTRKKSPIEEQNTALAIIGVLRKLVTDITTVHGDVHQALHKIEELDMKVSELAGKVDTLINVAMDIKAAAANASQGGAQADDPQVQEIADRIDQAVDALRDLSGQVPGSGPITTPPGGNPGPNPVPQPGQIDPATGLPVPQPFDPNAPVV